MNLFDVIIIYLACGAPFGVFYFVNQRNRERRVLIRSFLILLFWLPYAVQLLQKIFTGKLPKTSLTKKEVLRDQEVSETKKNLERIFLEHNPKLSVFELREILERYIGLTLALETQNENSSENSLVFKIAGNQNFELASVCYQRRNRKLLSFHQTLAGQDFLKLISGFVSRLPNDDQIEIFSMKLTEILDDKKTEKNLKTIFKNRLQSAQLNRVTKLEKEKWITDLQKQSPVNALQISMNQTAKINLPIKD